MHACVCARTLDYVTFVFIDDIFDVCVCVIIGGMEDAILFCLYNCMSYYFCFVA